MATLPVVSDPSDKYHHNNNNDGYGRSRNDGGLPITKRGKERVEQAQMHRQEYERNSSPEYQKSLLIPEKDKVVIAEYMTVLNHQGECNLSLIILWYINP